MANKNKNIQPSPFHKKGKDEGDSKRNWMGRLFHDPLGFRGESFLGFGKGETYGDDEWGIKSAKADMDKSFKGFQELKKDAGRNIYEGAENLIDVKDYYGDLENTMEDLTVKTQAADLQRDMMMQQNVNMLDAFRGGGGGSGAAALAQSMSGIQSQQAQQLAGQIGQQEQTIQMAAAQQEAQNQLTRAQALTQADLLKDQGAMEQQKMILGGEQQARELNIQMQQAELSYLAGLKEAAEVRKDQDTARKSDRRLKKNITKIGESNSGLNIYSFEYINPSDGVGLFQGVMSDEIPTEAIVNSGDWYDLVDYSMLDVEFKQI